MQPPGPGLQLRLALASGCSTLNLQYGNPLTILVTCWSCHLQSCSMRLLVQPSYTPNASASAKHRLVSAGWVVISSDRGGQRLEGQRYLQGFEESVFCLAATGAGWGVRLKLSVMFRCIPVIIADQVQVRKTSSEKVSPGIPQAALAAPIQRLGSCRQCSIALVVGHV